MVSEGFSGYAAGVSRRQTLPEKFRVRSGPNVQGIYMTREITNAWALTLVSAHPPPHRDATSGSSLVVAG